MSVKIPPGLIETLQKFTIAVLHQKPDNFVQFASVYFISLYMQQQKDGKTRKSKQSGQKGQAGRISFPDSAPLDGDDRPETPKKEQQRKVGTSEKHDPEAVTEEGKVVHPKTDEQKARIMAFNKNSHLFRSLNEAQMTEVIDAMFEKKFSEGDNVIKEGEEEDNYYIINSGTYDIFIGGKKYGVYKDKGSFADLALTYKQPTAVTMVATSDGSAWAMDKAVFQQIVLRNTYKRRKTYAQLIETVPNLTNDDDEEEDDDDMAGLQKLLRGILKYRYMSRHTVVKQFKDIKHTPQTSAVMFSCIDSRLVMSRLVHQDVGDMFTVRNAGNFVPNNDTLSFDSVTTEPGALELGCIIGNIRHVVVCGHSDCKAMHALIDMKDSVKNREGSPLQLWLKRHGARTVAKYKELLKAGGAGPILFEGESPDKTLEAFIDPDDRLAAVDKFSQVNTLLQLQNIASYPFLHEKLEKGDIHLHAFWFDINTGDFYMFSREKKRFIEISEETYKDLVAECEARQPKADGKTSQLKADGKTSQLKADGKTSQLKADGKAKKPKADGKAKKPKADGKAKKPKADGETSQPEADGETSQPEADGETSQPKADGKTSQLKAADDEARQPEADDETIQLKADGKASQLKADDEAIQLKADDETIQPKADGKAKKPKADGKAKKPKADGKTKKPKADGKTKKPKADGKAKQPEADGEATQEADGEAKQEADGEAKQQE